MLAMDAGFAIIQQCLNLTPVPYLGPAFSIFVSITQSIDAVQTYKEQLKELSRSIAYLLYTLNAQFGQREPLERSTLNALSDLGSLLSDILNSVTKQKSYGYFKFLFLKQDMQNTIDTYNSRITASINAFQIAALIDIQRLQQQNNRARINDQLQLRETFKRLESNQDLMIRAIDETRERSNDMDTMAALQKRIQNKQGDPVELQLFQKSLRYLKQSSGRQVDLQSWMITSLEVEFGSTIREGGFGTIYRGRWNQTNVALKVLKNSEGIVPREDAMRSEVETWSRLRHPNILQFLGISVLDNRPFIVMPLIEKGSVRDYLDRNPVCHRLKIIQQISLGIAYLHSQRVIHGDLKASNVLIDDGDNALLCDFGLARIKEDVDSRSSEGVAKSVKGSRNWMAPERLNGHSLRPPCDIYSFAMTMYEIYTKSVPFGSMPSSEFRPLVCDRRCRPERPSLEDASQLADAGWNLITRCWGHNPAERPDANSVSRELTMMLGSSDYVPSAQSNRSSTLSAYPPSYGLQESPRIVPNRSQTYEPFSSTADAAGPYAAYSHGSSFNPRPNYHAEPTTMYGQSNDSNRAPVNLPMSSYTSPQGQSTYSGSFQHSPPNSPPRAEFNQYSAHPNRPPDRQYRRPDPPPMYVRSRSTYSDAPPSHPNPIYPMARGTSMPGSNTHFDPSDRSISPDPVFPLPHRNFGGNY